MSDFGSIWDTMLKEYLRLEQEVTEQAKDTLAARKLYIGRAQESTTSRHCPGALGAGRAAWAPSSSF